MAMFGSSWKEEEPSDEEVQAFRKATGKEFTGSRKELSKEIEKSIDDFVSRKEVSDLRDLQEKMRNNE